MNHERYRAGLKGRTAPKKEMPRKAPQPAQMTLPGMNEREGLKKELRALRAKYKAKTAELEAIKAKGEAVKARLEAMEG